MFPCYDQIGRHHFIRDVVTSVESCKKYFLHTNVVGVEIAKCHTVTEKCTRQLALTAEKNVMFLSSQTVAGQFIAVSVTLNEDHHEDTKPKALCIFKMVHFYLF